MVFSFYRSIMWSSLYHLVILCQRLRFVLTILVLYKFVCMYVCMWLLVLNMPTYDYDIEYWRQIEEMSSDLAPASICLQCFDAVGWAAGRASGL